MSAPMTLKKSPQTIHRLRRRAGMRQKIHSWPSHAIRKQPAAHHELPTAGLGSVDQLNTRLDTGDKTAKRIPRIRLACRGARPGFTLQKRRPLKMWIPGSEKIRFHLYIAIF